MADKTMRSFQRRQRRTRYRLRQLSPGALRLCVFRSNKHIYAQLIDDVAGKTLVAAGSMDKDFTGKKLGATCDDAALVGKLLGERAKKAKVKGKIFFDRGGYLYHGRVKALADSAREAGLEF